MQVINGNSQITREPKNLALPKVVSKRSEGEIPRGRKGQGGGRGREWGEEEGVGEMGREWEKGEGVGERRRERGRGGGSGGRGGGSGGEEEEVEIVRDKRVGMEEGKGVVKKRRKGYGAV